MATLLAAAAPRFDDRQPRPVTRTFQLKELLELSYADALVSYPVTFAAGECRTESLRLLDDKGQELPLQLTDAVTGADGSLCSAKVWFRVDSLPALGQRAYTLYGSGSKKCRPAKAAPPPITWTPLDRETVEVTTDVFALRLAGNAVFAEPKDAATVGGPLQGFKGVDRVWRGAGELQVESPVTGHSLRIVEQGPLWITFASRFRFVAPPGTGGTQDGPYYEMRFTFYPGKDFCRVSEQSDFPLRLQPMPRETTGTYDDPNVTDNWRTIPCPADNFILNCEDGWQADHLYTHGVFSKNMLDFPLDRFRCLTALRAALPYMNGGWFSVYSSKGKDLLGLVGVDASHWQYPDNTPHPTARTPGCHTDIQFLNELGRGAYFRLPLARMQRHWLLVVTTREKVVRDKDWLEKQRKPGRIWFGPSLDYSTCYLWQLRYEQGDLPLNKVKDWVLDYDEPQADHPNLFPEARDREAVMRTIESFPTLKKHFDTWVNNSPHIKYFQTGKFEPKDGNFDTWTGIPTVKAHFTQGYNGGIYVLSMGQYVPWMIQFSDMVAPAMKPEDWKTMCRYALAGAYIMADDDYWQYTYVRGDTTYLPNFNTCRWYGIGLAGFFFPNHPESKKWIAFSRYYLEKEFDYHITKDGVGEENLGSYYPFAMRMMTHLVRLFQQRGITDYRTHPKYLAGAQVFLDAITPPDPRFSTPRRMFPPIGHHPYNTPGQAGLYEWNANTFQQVNPELAAWSHWAWLQCDQTPDFHYTMPWNFLWANKDFPAKAPPLKSKALEGFGYIFRNHFPSEKETYMSFKAGRTFYHHDGDEGSFHMYAKGVPLACDGLELIAHARASHHNSVEISKAEQDLNIMQRGGDVTAHLESPVVDWARGFFPKENTRKAEYMIATLHHTDWERNLLLIKSPNPDGAEYFAVFDHLSGPDTSTWNLDVHSEEPVIEPATANSPCTVRYPGIRKPLFNVGLDVIIVSPANASVEKERGEINKAQLSNLPVIEHWFIHSPREANQDTFAILYPRRADQPAPRVTPLANGRVCLVEHPEGRDILLAAAVPFTYRDNGVDFTGRLAVIRHRKEGATLTLLEGTQLSYGGKTLTAPGTL